ncbi:MAG: DUF3313 domain-containing protein [Proteobacteria bacterium]|nr:DUF3313 domain-containing protein [Pseudomonadota bacterium]
MRIQIPRTRFREAAYAITATLLIAIVATACSTTQQAKLKESDVRCAFLGADCALLKPGADGQMVLRYVNPKAAWPTYDQVLIDPVTFWGGDKSKISPADQESLTNFFFEALRTQIGQNFTLADAPGPGVMLLQVAITDLESATPGLRTISSIIPQARVLNTLKYAATGTYAFIGGAQVEGKVTDSVTGVVLAEAVDRRVGGGSLDAAMQWKWGDAENAMTKMATVTAERLKAWTSGAQPPK